MQKKEFVLNNNVSIPAIGFGTWQINEPHAVLSSLQSAISAGYRHIDTAQLYNNEKYIGQAIKQLNIPREELFITSKVWTNNREYDKVIVAFEQTLKDLGVDYLDLYLIHWPANNYTSDNPDQQNLETWRALEHLYEQGKVRAIGLSNFNVPRINHLITHAKIMPMVNQIEFHPGHMQKDIVEFCQANNILVQAWSPLGSGKLLNDITLTSIAKEHNVSVAQVCLNWILVKGVLPLPKSVTKERIIKNFNCQDFELSEQQIKLIDDMLDVGHSGLDAENSTY